MKASELLLHLSNYVAKSPENGSAEVMLKQSGSDYCFQIAGANDARGLVPGEHLLIIIPDESVPPLGVKQFRLQ